jgi:seryl-tRNA synthetase
MLDLKFIRENKDTVVKGAAAKNIIVDVEKLLSVDEAYRKALSEVEALRAERNIAAKERDIERGKALKEKLESRQAQLKEYEKELTELSYTIPNLPKDDVKVGKNDTENDVLRKYSEPRTFDFKVKDHLELGQALDIIDMERAAKVSGSRFYYLKNEGALLEIALLRFALDVLLKEGFSFIIPPVMVTRETMKALGYMENGGDEDMYRLEKDDMYLVGTAEHALVPMHKDEIFDEKELPKRYVGFSPAFRREAGSYGKDTRGILRVHQFDKVEMVSFVAVGQDDQEHEYLLGLEEKFFQALEIPYQVVKMCSGDLGFPASRKYDIEAWIPSQEKYREVTSVSTVGDFQSRRLNIKYRSGDKKEYAQILNGTAFSMARPIIAILENYQQKDGSVIVPKALIPYTNFEKITVKK